MDNESNPSPDDDNPSVKIDKNQQNLNESIFGLPKMFNSANFAQASILSKDAESTMASSVTGYTNIFSDVPSSTNNSPVSAHTSTFSNSSSVIVTSPVSAPTSIFGSVSNTHSTNPVSAQTSIFGDVPSSKLTIPTSAQASTFYDAINSTIETSKPIQPIVPSSEVDLPASDSELEQTPDVDPDASLNGNSDFEMNSNTSSRSISSSPEAPDFNAPAAPAPETFSLPSHRSSPSMRCNMPRNFQELSIMFNSTKRTAAIKGQAQRIGIAGADRDDSGTYDPSLERKRNTRNTRATTKKNKENGGETAKSVGAGNERKIKEQRSFELMVTIKLTSERGLAYLRKIMPGPEDDERNFPLIDEADDEDSVDDNEEEEDDEEIVIEYPIHSTRRKKIKTSHNRRSDGLTLSNLNNGHPQRRGCKSCFEAGNDECSLIEYSHEWPCESCEDAGIDCELIIPPKLKLSCIRCKEKLQKRCSYADDGGKDVDSCKACEEADAKCIAGPKAGSGPSTRMTDVLDTIGAKKKGSSSTKKEIANKLLATAIATVTNVAKPKAAPRKYVSCNRCRLEFKAKCTLKRDEEGPCSRCIKAKVPCTFTMLPHPIPAPSNKGKGKASTKGTGPVLRTPQDLTQTIILESTRLNDREWRTTDPHSRRTKAQQKAYERAISSSSPDEQFLITNSINEHNSLGRLPSYDLKYSTQATNQLIPPTFALHHKGIRTIIIPTSFAHPLIFNYKRDPMALYPPCDFHSTPFFGLFGYGIRHVTVVPWPSITGAGYEELENGWGDSGAGHEATRMCVKCTYERVKILGCIEHKLRPLEGLDERMRDDRLVRDSVKACEEGMMQGKWVKGSGETPERGSRADLVWRAKWCAVCPRPGDWICKSGDTCDGRRSLSHYTQGSQSHVKGCGLILCDTCYELHGKVQKGGKKGGEDCSGQGHSVGEESE